MADSSTNQSTTPPDRRDSMSPSRLIRQLTMEIDQIAVWNEPNTQGLQTREREVEQVQAVEPLDAPGIAVQLQDGKMTALEWILIFVIVIIFLISSTMCKALLVAILLLSHIDSTSHTNTMVELADIQNVSLTPVTSTSNDETSTEPTNDVIKMPTKLESFLVFFIVLVFFITCVPFHVFLVIALTSLHFFKDLHATEYITKTTAEGDGIQIANLTAPLPWDEISIRIENTPSVSKYANQGTSMDGPITDTGDASVRSEPKIYADKETSMDTNVTVLEAEKMVTNNSTQTESKGNLTLGDRLNAVFNSNLSDDEIVGHVKKLLGEPKRAAPAVHTPAKVPAEAKQAIVDIKNFGKITTLKLTTPLCNPIHMIQVGSMSANFAMAQWQSASKAWLRGFDDLSAWGKKNDEIYWKTSIDDTVAILEEKDKKDRTVPTRKDIILANLAEDDTIRQNTIPLLPPPATGSLAADPRYDWQARLACECANEEGIYYKYSF